MAPPKGRRQNQQASDQQAAEAALELVSESDEEVEEEGGTHVGGIYIPPAPPAVCSSENSGPRIIISHIVNTNFKSYAGTQVLGPFHKSFTSILGPNGSGKSNVIDSMLFVFGYRATKIRSKKISVLIHNSEHHRDIKSATVAVHFVQINDLGGEEFKVVPGSEIVISRTANRDNTSYYTINGKRSQFKEVAVLLRKQGIDLVHNRFLILQGEVEQIAMMNPKGQTEHETGMLEYLEDIMGTSRYKTPLKKLEAKLNLLNEEMHEKAKRAKILEEEREDLRGPMEEAIEFLSMENDVTAIMNKSLQVKIYHAEKNLENVEDEKKKLESGMADFVAKLKDFKAQQTTLEKEAVTRQKELDALKKEEEDIMDTLTMHERGITMLTQEIANTNKNRKKAIEAKKQEEEKLKDLEKIPDKNEKEIKYLAELAEKHRVAREIEEQEVDKVLAGLKAETQELQDEKDDVLAQLVGLKNTKDSAKRAFDLAKTEVALYQDNEKTEMAKLEKLKSTKEGNKKRLAEKQAFKAQMEEKLPEAEQRLDEAMSELQTLKRDEVTMTQELNSKRASMEEKRSLVNAFRSRNKVLNFIMQKKAEGALPGVFGRLGDLGGIEPRYDCAVSTACGPLDYIITDTVDTASKCLELLRKYDVGRGNFLALEKQAWLRSQYERRFSAPEDVPRLFDLIKVQDERLKPAFYFALRDTLVAEDLSQARRVAYGATRYRVVTLEGEIIEIAGTMSGGGRDKRTGRMGSSTAVTADSNPAELAQLEKKVVELQENLTGMHDRIRNREDLVSTLTRDTRKWRLDLNCASSEIKDLLQDAPTLEQRIEEQEEAVKAAAPDPDKVYELTSKVERLKEDFEKASEESDVVQKEVDKYTAQIKAITDGRMKEARSKLDATTKKLDKVNAEITKLTVEIKTSKRNSKKSLTKIENITAEITEAENLLRSCDKQLQKLMQDSNELDKKLKEVLANIKTEEVALKQVRSKILGMLKEVNIIKSAKIDEEQKLLEVTSRLRDGKAVLLSCRKENSPLIFSSMASLVDRMARSCVEEDLRKVGDSSFSDFYPLLGLHNECPPYLEVPIGARVWRALAQEPDTMEHFFITCSALDQLSNLKLHQIPFRAPVPPLVTYKTEEILAYDEHKLELDALTFHDLLKRHNPDLTSIDEFNKKDELYKMRVEELEDTCERRDVVRQGLDEVRIARLNEFMDGFAIISFKLTEVYQFLTLGGDAVLDLLDPMDPFSEGVSFSVRPPKKSWKNISNLSGGEKTLSSLALVFALHYYRPSPLYVMDEIDAALDVKNVSIVALYVKERTKNAQFIIISLRLNMIEHADLFVGIFKTNNCTQSHTITPAIYGAPPKGRRQNQQASGQQAAEAALEPVSESDEEVKEEGGTHVGGIYIPPAPPAVCSSENTGPRIIISHIINTNFKSYAGTQVLGPFHKRFTSIVGLNESGKSNVIDSMLFVFGYHATKIRSKKISVFIHNSEQHRDIKSATVAVHFVQINDLGGEEFEVVPGSEIVISRTANHDNTSYYTINGKRSQFKEVDVLLRKQGIDLVHNRFLILQGEVEQIAMMNPKGQTEQETGMLEYLEEIIGSARYKTPLKKLEAKLNLLNEETHEKAKRAKILEEEREDLRGPMEEAVEFLSLENDVTAVMNRTLQVKIYHAEKTLENVEEEKNLLETEMAEVVAKLKDFNGQQTTLEKEADTRQKELDALKIEEEDIIDTLTKHERGITMLKQETTNTNKKRKKAILTKKHEEEKLKDLEKILDKNEKEIKNLTELAEKHSVAREIEEQEVDKVLAGLKAETQELQDEKDVVLAQLVGLKNTMDSAKAAFDLAKMEVALYQNNEKTEKAKLEKLISTKEGNKKRLAEKQAVKAQMEEKLSEAEQRFDEALSELQTLKRDEVTMTQELHSKRASMEEKRSSVNEFRSRNKVLNFIMQKKAEGALPGVFGRLGDLGGIEPRYDCAVSTACGPLDYIVTDTIETASKCLELLRKYDIGRGNFLALEKQAWLRSQYERQFSAPENVPRLFDLIKVQDERLKPAFYFALRDTLVAEDLSQARRVADGATRCQVVTLEGEIVEIAGTMSGGGRDKRTGRMGSSAAVTTDSNPAELAQLEKKVVELQENLTGMQDRIRNRENLVSTLTTRDIRKWRLDLNSASAEIKDLLQDAPTLDRRIEEQEEAVKAAAPDPDKVHELTSKVERLKEEFEKASQEFGVVQKEVDKYTAQIKAITDRRMKEAQSKLNATTKKLDKVNAETTKLTIEIKTSKRNSKKSLTEIENITTEITEAENLLSSCDERLQKLMQDLKELDKKREEVLARIKTEEVAIKQVRAKVADMLKEVNIIKSAKIDEEQKLQEVTSRLGDVKAVLLGYRKELSDLKLHQIPFRAPVSPLVTYTTEEILAYGEQKLELDTSTFHNLLKRHNPDLTSIDEFNEKDELYKMRVEELEDACEQRDEVRQWLDDLRVARLNEFMEGFAIITFKLTEVYKFITLGGDAELDLLDSMDPFSEGVSFSVRPPKKSWENISNLSGGEKTQASLALLFALHYYRPSPLYFMDEIDSALDSKNVSILALFIKERTKNAQFIIISLQINMMEHADILLGLFKTNNCTQSHAITPTEYASDT